MLVHIQACSTLYFNQSITVNLKEVIVDKHNF